MTKKELINLLENSYYRIKYKECIELYQKSNAYIQKHADNMENKYGKKITKNKRKIKLSEIFILMFLIIVLLVIGISIVFKSQFNLKFIIIINSITLSIFSILILIREILVFKGRRIKKIKLTDYNNNIREIDSKKDIYLKNATKYIPELLLEVIYKEKYFEFRKNATKEKYKEVHDQLFEAIRKYIIKNKANKSYEDLISFYDFNYQKFTKELIEDNHKERYKLALVKNKLNSTH